MKVISIKYQDSCIYIDVKISQELRELIPNVRSIYVEYRIKVFEQVVKETYLVRSHDLIRLRNRLILILKVDPIQFPEDSQFFMDLITLSFFDHKKKAIPISNSYYFAEIGIFDQVYLTKERMPKPDIQENEEIQKPITITQLKAQIKEIPLSKNGLKIFEVNSSPSKMLKAIEHTIESRLDHEVKQLQMDLRSLCNSTLNLLISNIPLPQNDEDLRFNGALFNSVRKYIQEELIPATGDDN